MLLWATKRQAARTQAPKLPQAPSQSRSIIEETAQKGEIVAPSDTTSLSPYKRVAKALKQDLGDDYDTVLEAYKNGDVSLAELNQSRTRTLAQGAAQYPSGKAKAQEFFDPKIAGSYDRVLNNIKNNVTSVDSYHTTADDLLAAGRAKASPIYKEAFKKNIALQSTRLDRILRTPESLRALKTVSKNTQNEMSLMAKPTPELTALSKDLASMGKMEETKGGVASGLKLRALDAVKKEMDKSINVLDKRIKSGNATPADQNQYSGLIATKNA
ncbi:unnamed protein product, partial [marine sediment metagenome]